MKSNILKIFLMLFSLLIVSIMLNIYYVYADNETGLATFVLINGADYTDNTKLKEKDAETLKKYLQENFSYSGDLYTIGIKAKISIELKENKIIFYNSNGDNIKSITLSDNSKKVQYGFSENDTNKKNDNVTINLGVLDVSSGGGYHYYTLSLISTGKDAENAKLGERIVTNEEQEEKEGKKTTNIKEFVLVESGPSAEYEGVIHEEEVKEIEAKLRESYSYNGKLKTVMKISTKIKYEGTTLLIGEGTYQYKKTGIQEDDLSKYGRKDQDSSNSWDVVLITKAHTAMTGATTKKLQVIVTGIYPKGDPAIDDIEEGEEIQTGKTKGDEIVEGEDFILDETDPLSFGKCFLHNPFGTIGIVVGEAIMSIFDTDQKIIDFIVVWNNEDITNNQAVMREKDEILSNDNLNKYVNLTLQDKVSDIFFRSRWQKKEIYSIAENGESITKTIIIPGLTNSAANNSSQKNVTVKDNGEGYAQATKFPVILFDLYRISLGKDPIFDTNFLTIGKHDENEIWTIVRNVIVIIIRIILFITASFIITNLIFSGIKIVGSTITPLEKKKYIESVQTLLKSIVLLVGTIVIMALGIYFNIAICKLVGNNVLSNDLPLRVDVENVGSFSTTVTGYIRYLASIKNVDMALKKFGFLVLYGFMVAGNAILAILMIIRTFVLFFLGIKGPLIVLKGVLNIDSNKLTEDYKKWTFSFFRITLIQTVFILIHELAFMIV